MKLEDLHKAKDHGFKTGVDLKTETVTLLHGTTVVNAESIRESSFKVSEPVRIAHWVEDEYHLPRDSVLKHVRYEFPRSRRDLDHVHFTTDHWTAQQYTVPEQLQDALESVYWIKHPDIGNKTHGEVEPRRREWMKRETKKFAQPEVLVVRVPWKLVGDHGFGRKLTLEEFGKITKGDYKLPHNMSFPVKELGVAKIIGAYKP